MLINKRSNFVFFLIFLLLVGKINNEIKSNNSDKNEDNSMKPDEPKHDDFMEKNPEISNLLNNKILLKKLVDEVTDDDVRMCDSWEKNARQLMNVLWKVKDAEIFHKPVDPIELDVPNYYDVIKKPMDFSTVKKKLYNCTYTNLKEYCEDMNLIFSKI